MNGDMTYLWQGSRGFQFQSMEESLSACQLVMCCYWWGHKWSHRHQTIHPNLVSDKWKPLFEIVVQYWFSLVSGSRQHSLSEMVFFLFCDAGKSVETKRKTHFCCSRQQILSERFMFVKVQKKYRNSNNNTFLLYQEAFFVGGILSEM